MLSTPAVNDIFVSCRTPSEKKALLQGMKLPESSGRLTFFDRQEAGNVELSGFDLKAYISNLGTRELGQTLIYGKKITSTQTLLYSELSGTPNGAAFACYQQVSGRGRGSNLWESPVGCLCFSYKFSLLRPDILLYLQYLCCVDMIKTIKSFPGAEGLDIRIKWPNDIYSGPSYGTPIKLGGIIAQSTMSRGMFEVVIGIGINVSNSAPTTCLNALLAQVASSQGNTHPTLIAQEALLAKFLTVFEADFQTLELRGFDPFRSSYLGMWLHSDQVVTVGDSKQQLRIAGLSPSGYLRAVSVSDETQVYELQPDGNSFDFMQGLIVAKTL